MRLKDLNIDYLYLLVKNGKLGRKRQVKYFLSESINTGLNIKESELKKLYKKLQKQYKEIRVHSLDSTRIGEYISRYLIAVEDSKKNAQRGILDVFILTDCINHNARLSKVMGRNIQIVDETNINIWEYILCHFPKVKFEKYWSKYNERDKDKLIRPEDTAQYFKLTEEEEKEGQYKKAFMGLNRPFVCALSRDAVYLNKIAPRDNWHYHDYRDSNINKCNLSAEYLSQKGITMVRMGKFVKDTVDFNNCIDYANQYYDELMDIVLMKDCKFFLGDANGVSLLPMVFNKPLAFKNVIPAFLDAWGSSPQNSQNLFIFKKYYKKDENRFLSIKEMMEIEKKVTYYGQRYKKFGIEVVENSAEEILDLTMEMNARIDGEWIETPEDIELQKKYRIILEEWIQFAHLKENAMIHAKIGAMFLKKNPFLLKE